MMKLEDIQDIHTHNVHACAGTAIVNLPMEILEDPHSFHPEEGVLYSAGVFPLYEGEWNVVMDNLTLLSSHPQIVAIGECGLDKRSSMDITLQLHYFEKQMNLAEACHKPLIIHCVRCWDELIHFQKLHSSHQTRIIHGFRGKPQLAQQLLNAGFHLSFGPHFNEDSLRLCPSSKRFFETDDHEDICIDDVISAQANCLQGVETK